MVENERGKIMKNTMIKMNMKLRGLLKREEGQGMVEYALIVGGIAVIVIVIIALFRDQITTFVNGIFTDANADISALG